MTALETVDLTDAQKRDRRFYKDNTVLVLNQMRADFRRARPVGYWPSATEAGFWKVRTRFARCRSGLRIGSPCASPRNLH